MKQIRKIHGPYKRKDNRYHVVIVFEDGTKTTKSYPKLLMEQKLGRNLECWETVDHIDGDKTNNDINNLQILTRKRNSEKAALRRDIILRECPMCSSIFEINSERVKNARRKNIKAGPFCSKSCAGKYGAELQNNRIGEVGNSLVGKEVKYFNEQGNEYSRII